MFLGLLISLGPSCSLYDCSLSRLSQSFVISTNFIIFSNNFSSLSCAKAVETDLWKPGLSLFDTGKYLKHPVTSLEITGFHSTWGKLTLFIRPMTLLITI